MTQTKKMKTFKNLCLLFALMLGIAACSKEVQDAPQVLEATRSEEGKSLHVGSRDSIVVNFTIGAESEELRLAQSVNAEGVPFNPFMEEKDVVIRFAVRKQFNGRSYVTYTDAVCKKIAGENKANYKGVIRLPDLNYERYASWPEEYRPTKEGHEIAGILLGEANGGTQFVETVDANTVKTIEQTELLTSENDIVRSKVPYILDWTAFPLTAQGIQTSKQTLHFKPVGNLLRFQLNNQYAEAKTIESFKISTNAFITEVKFNFKERSLKVDPNSYNSKILTTISGTPIETLPENYRIEKSYELTTPIQVNANSKSQWQYLWVMPLIYDKNSMVLGNISFRTQIIGRGNDGKEYNMLSICSPLDEGSNKLTLTTALTPISRLATAFKGGRLPLWYVAEYDVAKNATSFSGSHSISGSNVGIFSETTLSKINIPGYFVPSYEDISTIIAGSDSRFFREKSGDEIYTEAQEIVRFPGETNSEQVTSIYKSVDTHNIYALRFEQCGSRDRLTAYRYELRNAPVGLALPNPGEDYSNARLIVTSKFLGSSFTGDINTISNPSFWSSSQYSSGSVSRVFPIYGEGLGLTSFTNISMSVKYLTTDKSSLGIFASGAHKVQLYRDRADGVARLLKNEFKTVK